MIKLLRTSIFVSPLTALVLTTACGSKPSAKAETSDSAAARSAGGEVTKPAAGVETVAASDSTARSRMFAGADTVNVKLNPSRNAHDMTSYVSAIKAGTRAMSSWPTGPAPLPGSLLPAKRIVAFYGNPLEKRMGVLGEYPVDEMLAKLDQTVAEWKKADPSTPVQPALHLVAVTAQGAPGRDGMYRLRMDTSLIEKVYRWAKSKNAILFLDVQVGKSTMQQELPRLLPFLARPDVHMAIDAEFSMHYEREGLPPGKKVGQFDAADVNYTSRELAKLVEEKKIPPKVLIVHRWTRRMISNASQIKLDPRVQIVMDMDGWGPPWLKFDSYRDYVVKEPVQFTGFKIFFHHDARKDAILTPTEVLRLMPRPLYIQYQ